MIFESILDDFPWGFLPVMNSQSESEPLAAGDNGMTFAIVVSCE